MIYWASLLHFYQPPTQIHEVLRKVVEESYLPLLEVFRQFPHARVSININGVLTEMLWEHGFASVIDGLRELVGRGQGEFLGSAKYHPILPLIPPREMRRQITSNQATNRHFFGEAYKPKGFFPPELGYSPKILGPIIDTGHHWVLASGVACTGPWPLDEVPRVSYGGKKLAVFFRDDILSNKISFQTLDSQGFLRHLKELGGNSKRDVYVVTAMDAETFGHHIRKWETLFLAQVYESLESPYQALHPQTDLAAQYRGLLTAPTQGVEEEAIKPVTLSELLDTFPQGKDVDPKPSSWSTTAEDLAAGVPYPLWQDPQNPIHRLQWEHTDIAIGLTHKAEELADNAESVRFAQIARGLLDPALHSDQFWWASCHPWWDMNMVHRGLLLQQEVIVNASKAIQASGGPPQEKKQANYLALASRHLRDEVMDRLISGLPQR